MEKDLSTKVLTKCTDVCILMDMVEELMLEYGI